MYQISFCQNSASAWYTFLDDSPKKKEKYTTHVEYRSYRGPSTNENFAVKLCSSSIRLYNGCKFIYTPWPSSRGRITFWQCIVIGKHAIGLRWFSRIFFRTFVSSGFIVMTRRDRDTLSPFSYLYFFFFFSLSGFDTTRKYASQREIWRGIFRYRFLVVTASLMALRTFTKRIFALDRYNVRPS